MSVYEVMMLLKEGEQVADRRNVEAKLFDLLHRDVASGKVRLVDVDDPLFAEYLDGGWDAYLTFHDYVERAQAKREAIAQMAGDAN